MIATLEDVEDKSAKWLTLTDGEEVLWKSNPHIIEYLFPIVMTVVLVFSWVVTSFVVDAIPLVTSAAGIGVGVAIVFMAHLRRITTIYVITNEEVYKRWGVISEDYKQIRMDKVQNTSVNLSWIERLLNFGDITVFTSGSGNQDMYIQNVPRPREVNEMVARLMDSVGDEDEKTMEEDRGGMWLPDAGDYRGID